MSEPYDPQRMGRVLHLAMEEILGPEETRSLLGSDGKAAGGEFVQDGRFSIARLGLAFSELERRYGEPAGRGLAQRIGRACFLHGLREYGEALGLTSASFRLLPFPSRLKTFAGKLADLFNSMAGNCVSVEEGEGKLRWQMEHCPFCDGRHSVQGVCLLPVGLAEEALYWLGSGKIFQVEEVACIARGDPTCIVQVSETPLS